MSLLKKVLHWYLCLLPAVAMAQSGNYFLSNYAPYDVGRTSNVSFDMAQDARGIMYFSTKSGILEFDGKEWTAIQGKGSVYAIHADEKFWWGGVNGFGTLEPNEASDEEFNVRSDSSVSDIFQCIATKTSLHFLSDNAVYLVPREGNGYRTILPNSETGFFLSLFELYDQVYVNTEKDGIYKIEGEKLVRSNLRLPDDSEVIIATRIEDLYALVTASNRVFMARENLSFVEVQPEEPTIFSTNVIVGAAWVSKQNIALGTLRGGVIFIDPTNGKIHEIINYNTGLPDNEVYAMMADRDQNVWVAHEYGYTRIAPFLPFRSFSHYGGLQGNILCVISHNNSVYAGTSLGLYKLEREEVYDEVEYTVTVTDRKKITKQIPVSQTQNQHPAEETAPAKEPTTKKRGFLSFLKKDRKRAEEEKAVLPVATPETETRTSWRKVSRQEKRTEKVLRSVRFVFKRVEGINAKVTQLIADQGKLYAAGLAGTAEVSGLNSRVIAPEPVRFLHPTLEGNLLVSTYDEKLNLLKRSNTGWSTVEVAGSIDDPIDFIFDGNANELWACGLNKVYNFVLLQDQVSDLKSYTIDNLNFDMTVGAARNEHVLFVNSSGFFVFKNEKVMRIDSMPKPQAYFASENTLWFQNENGWNIYGQAVQKTNLQLINLFKDLRFITPDQRAENLWLISGNNELFKYFGDRLSPVETRHPLFLRSIRNEDKLIAPKELLSIDQEKSSLTFHVVKPDYLGEQSVTYRYQLKGLDNEWSVWSARNNHVHFPFLPPGEYTLFVQAKDIVGNVSEMESVYLEVKPPYWKQTWFYAAEFSVFLLLVLLSFRLSSRFLFISRILSLLSIIIFIEFIQTVAGSTFGQSSPVIDFIIQVGIAFMILPVEGFLRRYFLQAIVNRNERKLAGRENPAARGGYVETVDTAKSEAQ